MRENRLSGSMQGRRENARRTGNYGLFNLWCTRPPTLLIRSGDVITPDPKKYRALKATCTATHPFPLSKFFSGTRCVIITLTLVKARCLKGARLPQRRNRNAQNEWLY